MHIKSIKINNLKTIKSLELQFESLGGWNVFLGDNGAGKSTLARAIALALAGPDEAKALRKNLTDWITQGETETSIDIVITRHNKFDAVSGGGQLSNHIKAGYSIKTNQSDWVIKSKVADKHNRYLHGGGKGWFSSSFGPYRRFSGGNSDYNKLFYSNPRLASHLSVFGEDVALTECLEWLKNLQFEKLEKQVDLFNYQDNDKLGGITKFINESGLLPHGTTLTKVSSKEVFFTDGNGCNIAVDNLSDGYRSILSLTIELFRQLLRTYSDEQVFKSINEGEMNVRLPGVVIIDEVDAHLHPSWQMRIGEWFTKVFPDIQFIVTTHSPLICHSAIKGSVWKLPTPGEDIGLQKIEGEALDRLLYGNILDAYGTGLFGANVGRSEEGQVKLQRFASLNQRSLRGKLTEEETTEHQALMKVFSTDSAVGLKGK